MYNGMYIYFIQFIRRLETREIGETQFRLSARDFLRWSVCMFTRKFEQLYNSFATYTAAKNGRRYSSRIDQNREHPMPLHHA